MPNVRPFRGLRYDEQRVGDLAKVTCPPYDVISPAEQQSFQDASPYNIIRVELAAERAGDTEADNRYTRAARVLREWRGLGVLATDDQPAFYIYDQIFQSGGAQRRRRAVLAAVELRPWADGHVLPHEETMSGPKADRLRLLRTVKTNVSPLFGLYPDGDHAIAGLLDRLTSGAPDADFIDEAKEGHRLWVVADDEGCAALSAALGAAPILIADGHHRYETALAFSQEAGGPAGAKQVLFGLVAENDPGLLVLPTHRTIQGIDSSLLAAAPARIAERFTVHPAGDLASATAASIEAELAKHGMPAFALAGFSTGQVSILTPAGDWRSALPTASNAWQDLDLVALHELLVKPVLGVDVDAEGEGRVHFTRDLAGALDRLRAGALQFVAVLNPPEAGIVRGVAEAGDRMPHKSTYFYPKLRTGVVMRSLED